VCGPSGQEQKIAGSEQQFTEALQSNYQINFAHQQQVLNQLNGILAPTLQAGPNQTGFNPAERAALSTQAIDSTGAAAANAARAIGNETAGRSDSGNVGEAGNTAALKASAASAGAGQLASEQLGITEADYATGRSNFNNAVGAEEGVAGQYNPVGTAGAANEANKNAFGEASAITQQQNQMESDIAGGITNLATGIATGGISGFTSGFGGGGGGMSGGGSGAGNPWEVASMFGF
jgi:hypothetical protein